MNKRTFILLAGFAALLFSCSGDSVQGEEQSSVETKAKLYVTVKDAGDGSLVKGAKLTMQSVEKQPKVITSDNGMAVFENIHVGLHTMLAEAGGYASLIMNQNFYIAAESNSDIYFAQDNAYIVQLYSLTASIEGSLYHYNAKGDYVPMANVPIRFEVTSTSLLEGTRDTITDENGKFVFDSLPAVGTNYRIISTGPKTPDGKTYGAATIFSGSSARNLRKDAKVTAGTISYPNNPEASLFIVTDYKKIIGETEALTFKFSDSLNNKLNNASTVIINNNEVANITWKDSSVTLTPVGKWKGNADGQFIVTFDNLRSAKNQQLSTTPYTITLKQADLKLVEGLLHLDSNSIAYDSTHTRIIFKKVDGATGYKFYLQEEIDGKTVTDEIACTGNVSTKTDSIVKCPVSKDTKNAMQKPIIGSKTNTIIVQAYNARSENEFSKSSKVEIKEIRKTAPDLLLDLNINSHWFSDYICDSYIGGGDGINPCKTEMRGRNWHTQNGDSSIYFYDNTLTSQPTSYFYSDLTRKLNATVADTIAEGRLFFNRAMDTSKEPAITCTSAGVAADCGRLDMKFKWINEQNLSITLVVKPGAAATNTDATIKIGNLFGLNGVPFASKYNNPFLKDTVKTVNIEFEWRVPSLCEASPAAPGCEPFPLEDFEDGTASRFERENYSGTNHWVVDSDESSEGDYSAYISQNTSFDYNPGVASDARLYAPVTFHAADHDYTLSFDYRSKGYVEPGPNAYDYLVVCLVPANTDPMGIMFNVQCGDPVNNYFGSNSYNGNIVAGPYYGIDDWVSAPPIRINLEEKGRPAGDYWLMFRWVNSSYSSNFEPAAIDNVMIK